MHFLLLKEWQFPLYLKENSVRPWLVYKFLKWCPATGPGGKSPDGKIGDVRIRILYCIVLIETSETLLKHVVM